MTNIATPLDINGKTEIKNRLFKSAMSEQMGDHQHNPLPCLATLYRTWAEGGIGLSMTGNVMVDRDALGEPSNVVLDEHSDLSGFRTWADAGKQNGSRIWMQINHPGKQSPSALCKEPLAPSAIPLAQGLEKAFNMPKAMSEADIQRVVKAFATAARLAKQTGFDGVQIHGAHGYLVSQFLSPRHNQRQDEWGGSAENRMRFVLEIYRAIREQVGEEYPVGIKLNSADFMKGGFTEEESMAVIKALDEAGIDQIEISGGTYESPAMMDTDMKESTRKREAFFIDYAEKVRKLTNVSLVVTGGFRSTAGMNDALAGGALDMVGLGRPLAVMPDMPNRVMASEGFQMEVNLPSTGFPKVDQMVFMGISWYEAQLELIGKGKQPKLSLSAWKVVWSTLSRLGMHAFRQRRA